MSTINNPLLNTENSHVRRREPQEVQRHMIAACLPAGNRTGICASTQSGLKGGAVSFLYIVIDRPDHEAPRSKGGKRRLERA